MTARKPGTMTFESWIEAQIREAQDRGEFDDLPGKGKPLPGLDGTHDELWWVTQLLAREGLSYLPPALAIRLEAEKVLDGLGFLPSEAAVRRVVDDLNTRIRQINRMPRIDGPPSTLMPLDVEVVVARWRVATEEVANEAAAAAKALAAEEPDTEERGADQRPEEQPARRRGILGALVPIFRHERAQKQAEGL